MQFKTNLHKAKNLPPEKVNRLIKNYPNKYPTPKYLIFAKIMQENGWNIKIYIAKVSKYLYLIKKSEVIKVRFSNHKPNYYREWDGDCDYYVGVSNKKIQTTEEVISKILKNYGNSKI